MYLVQSFPQIETERLLLREFCNAIYGGTSYPISQIFKNTLNVVDSIEGILMILYNFNKA